MSKDVRLTKTASGYYDLLLEDGAFAEVTEGTEVAQNVMIRLGAFKGEYSLNSTLTGKDDYGTDYYGIVFDMSKPRVEKELEIKRIILATNDVEKIITFTWEQLVHSVTVESDVKTIHGEASVSQEITPL